MQKFDYRYPRFSVDLPARFTTQGSTLTGRCKDISHEGMRLELPEPLPPNARGTVSVIHQGRSLELTVRVAHAANGGIEFLYESDDEREAVAQLVTLLSRSRTFGPSLVS
jgi:PilZ domain-containing protein